MNNLLARINHVPVVSRLPRSTSYLAATLLALLLALTGCGLFAATDEPAGPVVIRTVHPTFTPTVPPTPAPAQNESSSSMPGQETPSPPGNADDGTSPRAVINGPLVNARSGPGVEYDIVGTLERGAELEIIGTNPDRSWWHVCCVEAANAWVTSEFVDTLGAVDSVTVVGGASEAAASAPPSVATDDPAAAGPVTPTSAPAPAVSFDLEAQEQFPETSLVRVFLYVYAENSALEGYSLRVTKDGEPLSVSGSSFGGQPAFTWPFQDPRQRFQNFKAEFPDTAPQGVWQVQLIDSTGATVGPPAIFTLNADDPAQELYVRYARQ